MSTSLLCSSHRRGRIPGVMYKHYPECPMCKKVGPRTEGVPWNKGRGELPYYQRPKRKAP